MILSQCFLLQTSPEIKTVTDQKSSGRCWIYACLNVLRIHFARKYNLEEFEFSQTFIFFWDKVRPEPYTAFIHQSHIPLSCTRAIYCSHALKLIPLSYTNAVYHFHTSEPYTDTPNRKNISVIAEGLQHGNSIR